MFLLHAHHFQDLSYCGAGRRAYLPGFCLAFAWLLPAMGALWPACCIARFNVGQSSFQIANGSIRIILILLV